MMINFSEEKIENLSENLENGLRYIGKAMQCIDELRHGGSAMGQRGYQPYRMGQRDGMEDSNRDYMGERYGSRGGYRDPYFM